MAETTPIGIDLGTTRSVIAFVDKDGRPATIKNAEGETTTPSVVFFDDSGPIIGREAADIAAYEPEQVIQFAKRLVGVLPMDGDERGDGRGKQHDGAPEPRARVHRRR